MKQNNFIKTCHWEITKRCNLSCIHCISAVGNKRELKTSQALKVIDILNNLGCKELHLTGGEPLVRKDIFEILKRAKKYKLKISLLTNGTLINDQNIKEIKKYVNEIGISLDGSCSKINDKIRSRGSFKKTINAIRIIRENRVAFTLHITLNKINLDDLKNILKLASNLKIKNIRINEISLRGRAFRNREFLNLPYVGQNLKNYIIKSLTKYFQQKQLHSNNRCDIKPKIIFLSPTGYVYPCVEIFQTKITRHLGNILNHNFDKLKRNRKGLLKLQAKKFKCPYQVITGNNLAIYLDNPSTKCPLVK